MTSESNKTVHTVERKVSNGLSLTEGSVGSRKSHSAKLVGQNSVLAEEERRERQVQKHNLVVQIMEHQRKIASLDHSISVREKKILEMENTPASVVHNQEVKEQNIHENFKEQCKANIKELDENQAEEKKKMDDNQSEQMRKLDDNKRKLEEDQAQEEIHLDKNRRKLDDEYAEDKREYAEDKRKLDDEYAEDKKKLDDAYAEDKRRLDDEYAEEEEKLKQRFEQKLEDTQAQPCAGNATVRDSATEDERARVYPTNPSSSYDIFKQRLGKRYENRKTKLAARYESQKEQLATLYESQNQQLAQLKRERQARHAQEKAHLAKSHAQERADLAKRHAQERADLAKSHAQLAKRHAQERAHLAKRHAQERADLAKRNQDLKQQLVEHWAQRKKKLQQAQEKDTAQINLFRDELAQLEAKLKEIKEAECRFIDDWFRRDVGISDSAKARSIPCYTGYAWMYWLTAKWQLQPDQKCEIQSCCTEFTDKLLGLLRHLDNSAESEFTARVSALFSQFLSQAVSPEMVSLCRSSLRSSRRKYPVEPDIRICWGKAGEADCTFAIFEMKLNLSRESQAITALQQCAGYYLECTDKVKGSSGNPHVLGVTMSTKLCFMYLMLKGSTEVVCLQICELNLREQKDVQVFFETLYTAIVDLERLRREHRKLRVFNKPIFRESWDPRTVEDISNRKLGARSNVVAYENRVYKLIRKRSSDSEELFENKRLNYAKLREKLPETMPGLREEQNVPFYPSNKYLLLSYDKLNGSHLPWCVEQIQRIGYILIEAHKNDLIHGDVRLANMIFAAEPNTDAFLIDWDLAGTVKSTYPKGYNHSIEGDLGRHPCAVEDSHLSPAHDWYSFGDFLRLHFPPGNFPQNVGEARLKLISLCMRKSELIENDIEECLHELGSTPSCNPLPS